MIENAIKYTPEGGAVWVKTIYNYRSKLRNAAATDPGTFEAEVARIGEIKLD